MPFVWFFGVYLLAASISSSIGDDPAFAVAVGLAAVLYAVLNGKGARPVVSKSPWLFVMAAIVWFVGETATFCQIGKIGDVPLSASIPITVVAYPVFEEIIFRGVAYGAWGGDDRPVLAAVLTTAAWSALHANVALLPLLVLNGLFLALVRERTGSIWTGLMLHIAENCAVATTLVIDMIGAAKTVYALFAVLAIALLVKVLSILASDNSAASREAQSRHPLCARNARG